MVPEALRNQVASADRFLSSETTALLSSFEPACLHDWATRLSDHLTITAPPPTERLVRARDLTDRAIRLIDPGASIQAVCHRLQISQTWLTAATKMAAGLRPYEILRLRRFRAIAKGLHAGIRRVGDAEGFADQAHLIREFRRLSGNTPGSYVRKPTRYAGHISAVDRWV